MWCSEVNTYGALCRAFWKVYADRVPCMKDVSHKGCFEYDRSFTWRVYSLRSLFRRGAMVPCQLWLAFAETAISNSVSIRWLRWVCTIRWGSVNLNTGAAPEGGTFCIVSHYQEIQE